MITTYLHPHAIEACGLVLPWALSWAETGSLKGHLSSCYGFPMPRMEGGTVQPDGTYTYPEDPDLKPLVKVEFESCVFYQYPYGIISIVSEDETFTTRLD